MLAQLKAAVGEVDYGRLSARSKGPARQTGAPEPASSDERARNHAFGRPHFGRRRAEEKEGEMMIALLHDFLPRGAKRVLIAVAGIFGALSLLLS